MLTFYAGVAGLTGTMLACDEPPPPDLRPLRSTPVASHVEFVKEEFADLYPTFCVYRSMPRGQKAALWQEKYFAHWVRWTGILQSITPNGITVRHLDITVTFDVSLRLERDELKFARERFRRGDQVTYVGRLEAYDDVFQKLYLSHGVFVRSAVRLPRPNAMSAPAALQPQ